MWKRLAHPNIVPLLCITSTPLQLISEWMPGGVLTEYIGHHPEADLLGLVGVFLLCTGFHAYSRRQLSDIAGGLHFIHSFDIAHGDLKGVRNCSEPCSPLN